MVKENAFVEEKVEYMVDIYDPKDTAKRFETTGKFQENINDVTPENIVIQTFDQTKAHNVYRRQKQIAPKGKIVTLHTRRIIIITGRWDE